jgi:hypothetical protein
MATWPRERTRLRFSAFGRTVLVLANKEGNSVLIRLNLNDPSQAVALASGDLGAPACTADGKHIFYMNFADPKEFIACRLMAVSLTMLQMYREIRYWAI